MLAVAIKTIPHKDQRYDTAGDYTVIDQQIEFRISDMGNWKYEFLVAFHELIEKMLCVDAGVNDGDIDNFDMDYERKRKEGDDSEPGDSTDAPYRRQHRFASNMERLLAAELGINWKDYEKTMSELR